MEVMTPGLAGSALTSQEMISYHELMRFLEPTCTPDDDEFYIAKAFSFFHTRGLKKTASVILKFEEGSKNQLQIFKSRLFSRAEDSLLLDAGRFQQRVASRIGLKDVKEKYGAVMKWESLESHHVSNRFGLWVERLDQNDQKAHHLKLVHTETYTGYVSGSNMSAWITQDFSWYVSYDANGKPAFKNCFSSQVRYYGKISESFILEVAHEVLET